MTAGPAPLNAAGRHLSRLPADIQARLLDLARQAQGLFGRPLPLQRVVDAHLDLIENLIAGGATYAILADLLAEIGITRADGRPLTDGTVSSAVHRARRARRPAPPDPPAPAGPGMALHGPAGSGTPLPPTADIGDDLHRPTVTGIDPQAAVDPSNTSPPISAAARNRAAALTLNQLRHQQE